MPVTPVFGLDVASAVAVCVLGLLLCVETVCSAIYPPPSSVTISVIREDNTLAASPASDCTTWELGAASTAAGLDMVVCAFLDDNRKSRIAVLYVWVILYSWGSHSNGIAWFRNVLMTRNRLETRKESKETECGV
jgi:hypothetical protein